MRHVRLLVGAVAVIAATTGLAWALARPELPVAATFARAVADCAAVVALGLALVSRLDGPRYRDELVRRAAAPLAVAASTWLLAELARVAVSAMQAEQTSIAGLSARSVVNFVWLTTGGRSALFSACAAALVCVLAVAARPTAAVAVGIAGIAATGVAARAVTGHIAENAVGAVAVVVHAIAAGVWCGVLAALALVVTARGQWARVLPRFSQLALGCVAALLLGGLLAALVSIDAPADLVDTGYGRILLTKVVVTAALLVLAWHNRNSWLRGARAHRLAADASFSRAVTELVLMTGALTLAGALTLTG